MKNRIFIIMSLLLLLACEKKKVFDGPDFFQDNFETYFSLSDLLPDDDKLWSFTQLTKQGNTITVDSTHVHSGSKSLKFVALKSDNNAVSKCSIAKQNMAFWDGETIRLSAWYYIEATDTLHWLFLLDLEEQIAVGASPGIRLAVVNNKLRVNYKFDERDVLQVPGQEIDFPRNQWVEVVWEVKLSQKHKGSIKLWQDGKLIIDSQKNRTLPKDILYFSQGTKGMYSSIEIGITANSQDKDLSIWVDDVKFEKVE